MELNFLYLLGPLSASRWANNEIRYSLRSVEFLNPTWVGITGPETPSFLRVNHVKVELQEGISRYFNTQRQLLAACLAPETPENLILMNDDFIVRPEPMWDWRPTHTGEINRENANPWRQSVIRTGTWCKSWGVKDPVCYEGHTPMPFLKSKAIPILGEILQADEPLQFRTAYGNIVGVGGELHPNAKRGDPSTWPENSPFWSLKGNLSDRAKRFLENWLSEPSRWEVHHVSANNSQSESRPLVRSRTAPN